MTDLTASYSIYKIGVFKKEASFALRHIVHSNPGLTMFGITYLLGQILLLALNTMVFLTMI